MTTQRTIPRTRPAFTLIELLAVLVVTGALAVVSIPAFTTVATARQRAATHALGRDLTFARQRAQATGVNSWVVFSTSAHTWSILAENPQTPGRLNAAAIVDPATRSAFITRMNINDFAGVRLSSVGFANNEVGFDRFGRPLLTAGTVMTANASVTLNGGGAVSVAGSTGCITITPQ